jgi:hypothetical protein
MAYTSEMLHHMGGVPVGGNFPWFRKDGHVWFVDGSTGSASNSGKSPKSALNSITNALAKAGESDTIFVFPKRMAITDEDPGSYAETFTISQPNLSLIGVGRGLTQGGLPQIKIGGDSTTAMITVSAPGVLIANIGINGASSTGGGIKIVETSGSVNAFGLEILNCHFKNCKAHATNGAVGGAIYLGSAGGAWQLHVKGCRFYKCVGGIVVPVSVSTIPQDWVIEDCVFHSSVNTEVDGDIIVGTGGLIGFVIRNCDFATVDVPTGTSGTVQRYIKMAAGSKGAITNCRFACISQGTSEKTFGAAGDAVYVPTTVRFCGCFGEAINDATGDSSDLIRTP